jgi:hypothetical protein
VHTIRLSLRFQHIATNCQEYSQKNNAFLLNIPLISVGCEPGTSSEYCLISPSMKFSFFYYLL